MHPHISSFIDSLVLYDYLLFGAVFILFILFIILGIVLRNKIFLATIFITLAFSTLLAGPVVGYIQIHKYLFAHDITDVEHKKLEFTQAVVVKGVLKNSSKKDFSHCDITASAFKVSGNKYKDLILSLKPFQKSTIIEYDIPKEYLLEFKIIIEPFVYSGDYNISVEASCQ